MAMEQPWMFRPTFAESWITDMIFTKENGTILTKDLHRPLSTTSSDGDAFSAEMVESLFAKPATVVPFRMPTASCAFQNDAPASKQRRSIPPSGRVAKRKSRASKRATTTFIKADPANFRQMVQQVTGMRLGCLNGQLPVVQVLKPEPQRDINRIQQATALSTSSSFIDGSTVAPPHAAASSTDGIDLSSFCSFPTLESWKVM